MSQTQPPIAVSADYNARDMHEYYQGHTAFTHGLTRRECPYDSGHGSAGYSIRRHAWMVGHLDAEFSEKSYAR